MMQMDERIAENIREEARRAKAIAVEKYKAGDFAGAKEFAVKAQKLNPALCGLLRLNAVLDVRMGFAKKINGEIDWYAVLSVEPTADLETIQERYRKLYLDISLDTDNSVGSIDEANMLLADSWKNLCNEERKQLYDKRRQEQLRLHNLRRVSHVFPGFLGTNSPSSSSSSDGSSFWTSCRSCSMKYEYPNRCKNNRVMCVRCCKPFEAFECLAPSMTSVILRRARASQVPSLTYIPVVLSAAPKPVLTSRRTFDQVKVEPKAEVKVEPKAEEVKVEPKAKEVKVEPKVEVKVEPKVEVKVEPKVEVKVEPKAEVKVEPKAEVKVEPKVEVKVEQPPLRVSCAVNQLRRGKGGESKRKGPPSTNLLHVPQLRRTSKDAGIRRDRLELTPSIIRSALIERGMSTIKLFLERLESASQQNDVGSTVAATKVLQDLKKCNAAKRVKLESNNSDDMVMEEEPSVVVVSVPNADFCNFDKDRVEASFGENQVWAAYDDHDGMPRFYALVHSVVSQEPFKLCISWLSSKNNEELGTMKWIDSGFYKTSGRFSIGKRNNYESFNSLSHRVKWTKGAKGFVHIYPKKGDVWALYTNWSPSWNSSTPKEDVNKYEMVEVLQDFNEGGGVTVVPLVKVSGFITVFRRHPNQRTFPRNELFRFSHQVASHFLTSQDGENAPEGCLELDPAALSPELLKVVTKEKVRELENVVIKKPNEEAGEAVQPMENVAMMRKLETMVKKPKEEVHDVQEISNNAAIDDETKMKVEMESDKEKKD